MLWARNARQSNVSRRVLDAFIARGKVSERNAWRSRPCAGFAVCCPRLQSPLPRQHWLSPLCEHTRSIFKGPPAGIILLVKLITFIGYSRVGKSSAIVALATALQQEGRRVRILHNGPGRLTTPGAEVLDVVEIHGGCVCCDLAMGLFAMLKKWAQEQPPLDVVILEGSPVASPDTLEIILAQLYGWVNETHLVTMTDAERMARVGRPLDYLTERQVASADLWFVVNADRADPARLDEVIAALKARAAPQKIGRVVEAMPALRSAVQM